MRVERHEVRVGTPSPAGSAGPPPIRRAPCRRGAARGPGPGRRGEVDVGSRPRDHGEPAVGRGGVRPPHDARDRRCRPSRPCPGRCRCPPAPIRHPGPPRSSSASQRSPRRRTSTTVPRTRTRRHSSPAAAPAAGPAPPASPGRARAPGRRHPGGTIRLPDDTGDPHTGPRPAGRRRGPRGTPRSPRSHLDDRAPAARVEERAVDREHAVHGHPGAVPPERCRDGDRCGLRTVAAAPADGDGEDDGAGREITATSPEPRSQMRYPSSAPLRDARCPSTPVNAATRPLRWLPASSPAEASA